MGIWTLPEATERTRYHSGRNAARQNGRHTDARKHSTERTKNRQSGKGTEPKGTHDIQTLSTLRNVSPNRTIHYSRTADMRTTPKRIVQKHNPTLLLLIRTLWYNTHQRNTRRTTRSTETNRHAMLSSKRISDRVRFMRQNFLDGGKKHLQGGIRRR